MWSSSFPQHSPQSNLSIVRGVREGRRPNTNHWPWTISIHSLSFIMWTRCVEWMIQRKGEHWQNGQTGKLLLKHDVMAFHASRRMRTHPIVQFKGGEKEDVTVVRVRGWRLAFKRRKSFTQCVCVCVCVTPFSNEPVRGDWLQWGTLSRWSYLLDYNVVGEFLGEQTQQKNGKAGQDTQTVANCVYSLHCNCPNGYIYVLHR